MTLSGIKGDIQVTSYIKVYCTLHGYRNIIEKVIFRNMFEKLGIFNEWFNRNRICVYLCNIFLTII